LYEKTEIVRASVSQ